MLQYASLYGRQVRMAIEKVLASQRQGGGGTDIVKGRVLEDRELQRGGEEQGGEGGENEEEEEGQSEEEEEGQGEEEGEGQGEEGEGQEEEEEGQGEEGEGQEEEEEEEEGEGQEAEGESDEVKDVEEQAKGVLTDGKEMPRENGDGVVLPVQATESGEDESGSAPKSNTVNGDRAPKSEMRTEMEELCS